MTENSYARLAASVGVRIGTDLSWLRVDVIEQLSSLHRRGAQVVIATASEHRLASSLLRAASVPFHQLSASRIESTLDGMRVTDYRTGPRKAEALEEAGIVLSESLFITDSAADIPTARLARYVALVGAKKGTREQYSAAGIDIIQP